MTERPILFSAPMVRSIIASTKRQTRRTIKRQPSGIPVTTDGRWFDATLRDSENAWQPMRCPYGVPGDRLWVREAWRTIAPFDRRAPRALPVNSALRYEADGATINGPCTTEQAGRLRPGMFMPRWASRITLEVVGVRVERLQDISEADAAAEGWTPQPGRSPNPEVHRDAARDWYADLWDSINGAGSWSANPWVWCVEFTKATT